MSSKSKLGPRQQRFVDEYMVDLNATRAAIAAGYSKTSAAQAGWEVLRNPKVAVEVSRRQARLAERLSVSSENVISELAKIAFANVGDFYRINDEGQLSLDTDALADPTRTAALSQLDIIDRANGDRHIRLKLADKRAALADLDRHLNLAQQHKAALEAPSLESPEEVRHQALAVLHLLRRSKFIDSYGRPTEALREAYEAQIIEQ